MFEEFDDDLSISLSGGLDMSFSTVGELSDEDRAAWRDLASQRTESAPFVDPHWTTSWIDAFSPRELVMLSVRETGALVGLAFLMRCNQRWAGKDISVLRSITNDWSYRFEFLAQNDRPDILRQLWTTLLTDKRWDVIRLDWLPGDTPTMSTGLAAASELGWKPVVIQGLPSPWHELPEVPASWDEGLKGKFKSNLRNRERRLEAQGKVSFEVVGEGENIDDALRVFFELESSGWKREHGTAILMQPGAKRLFDGLVDRASKDIWVPVLSCGGRPVAAQLIRVYGDTMFLLKTAYSPDFSPYSPGQLVTARVIKFGIERGMRAFDFLGVPMTWKNDWAPECRPNATLVVCSPSAAGRYAYWTRYGVKDLVKRMPGSVRLVRRLRVQRNRK